MKTRTIFSSCVLAVAAVAIVGVLAMQWVERARLEKANEAERIRREEVGRLRAENERLAGAQPDAAEVAELRADRAVLDDLRRRVAELKASTQTVAAREVKSPASGSGGAQKRERTILDAIVPESAWRNAGYATPAAAMETALWAAAGGDVELLGQSLILEPEAREKAAELLAGLPAEMRSRYASPELLVAALAAKDVPLGGARILDLPAPAQSDAPRRVGIQLRDHSGGIRYARIIVRETPEGWRLVVPGSAVENYARELAGEKQPAPVGTR